MSHLENNNILYDLQHGFRPSRSCETQLISFLQHVSQSNNQNIQTDVVIMDFAKAFDKVPHQHLGRDRFDSTASAGRRIPSASPIDLPESIPEYPLPSSTPLRGRR